MAKSTFTIQPRTKVTAEVAAQKAAVNDAKNVNFELSAETGEELTLTGEFFESVWERFEDNVSKGTGIILFAGAKRPNGTNIEIPFGLFKSANKLASGGQVIECKAHFNKGALQSDILSFAKTKAKVTVARYTFFREGFNNESEITKVL